MSIINQILAADVSITDLISSANPAPKLAGITSLSGLLSNGGFNLINLIFVFVGLFFFGNLIVVGWEFMFSSGDKTKTAAASTRLINGIIGLIIVAAAFLIVRLITTMLGLGTIV